MRNLLTALLVLACGEANAGSSATVYDADHDLPAVRLYLPDGYAVEKTSFQWLPVNPSPCQATIGATLRSPDATIEWRPAVHGAQIAPESRASMPNYFNIPLRDMPAAQEVAGWYLPEGATLLGTTQLMRSELPMNPSALNRPANSAGTVAFALIQGTLVTSAPTGPARTVFRYRYADPSSGEDREAMVMVTLDTICFPGATAWWTHAETLTTRPGKLDAHAQEFATALYNTRPLPVWSEVVFGIQQSAAEWRTLNVPADAIRPFRLAGVRAMPMGQVMDNWRRRNEIQDRSFQDWDVLAGLDDFLNPDGSTVKLPRGSD